MQKMLAGSMRDAGDAQGRTGTLGQVWGMG